MATLFSKLSVRLAPLIIRYPKSNHGRQDRP